MYHIHEMKTVEREIIEGSDDDLHTGGRIPRNVTPGSAAASLPPIPECCMYLYLYCEEAVIQGNQTAGSAEPDGGRAQGCPQYAGGGKASATGFTRWQRREMAHHQFQTGRPCHGQMGIAWAFPSSNSRKSSKYATRQESPMFSLAAKPSIIGPNGI
jgi:hypothetical protein